MEYARSGKETTLDRENDLFQVLLALKSNRRKRSELGEVFVESVAAIKAASARGYELARALYTDYAALSDWAKLLIEKHSSAERIRVSSDLMGLLSDREDPSELIVTLRKSQLELGDVVLPQRPFIVILDRPSNHGNLGSIIRSCDAFGVDLVVTTGHSVDIYDRVAQRH